MHDLDFSLNLESQFCNGYPFIKVGLNHEVLYNDYVKDSLNLKFIRRLSNSTHNLWIEYNNKTNENCTATCDQCVIIKDISFENISLPRFIWAGKFYPVYPEPYASQQKELGIKLDNVMYNIDYLGFNGKWNLQFTTPIFTWIHKLENLGWIFS